GRPPPPPAQRPRRRALRRPAARPEGLPPLRIDRRLFPPGTARLHAVAAPQRGPGTAARRGMGQPTRGREGRDGPGRRRAAAAVGGPGGLRPVDPLTARHTRVGRTTTMRGFLYGLGLAALLALAAGGARGADAAGDFF